MTREYDDKRFLQWAEEFRKLIEEYLDTEGNDEDSLQDEYEMAVENARVNLS